MAVPESLEVIQATLAPAFLISATSIFLNFTQNRLFRVVDRVRALATQPGEQRPGARPMLLRRAHILRNAITLGVATVAFTVLTAILVMASEIIHIARLSGAAPYAFAVAMLCLFAALCFVQWDTILSVRSVEREP